jgi:peptide/nickel transport system substrate-binding protein
LQQRLSREDILIYPFRAFAASIFIVLNLAGSAVAEEIPHRGGILAEAAEGGPETFDCHAAALQLPLQYLSPEYSTLLRYVTSRYPDIEGDTAESWSVSDDGLTYRFRLRPGIKFHDGTTFGADDVKATFERLRNPPTGVISVRKANFADIDSIEVVDTLNVAFHMARPKPSMLGIFADPFNCLYSAKRLALDPTFPAKNVMGTGPFQFVAYTPGDTWTAKRFEGYFRAGHPFLDGIKIVDMAPAAVINALTAGLVDVNFRFVSPAERDRIAASRGDKTVFQTSELAAVVGICVNSQHKPFDDVRVRRALALAIDHPTGEAALSKMTTLKGIGGLIRPGYQMALPAADLAALPGFGPDVAASRARARQLLADAGVPGLQAKLLNRSVANPYQQVAIFAIDQFRQIGVTVEQVIAENALYYNNMQRGNFDLAVDPNSAASDDPTDQFLHYLPGSASNYTHNEDAVLADLYEKQKLETDPARRQKLVSAFETRVIDQAYFIPLFWNERIVPLASNVRGWHITPISRIGLDLGDVWLADH